MGKKVKDGENAIGGFLSRLRRDVRGNTLAIVAASIFPLVGMIGGAVDISRLYLTRTRLQQACDAGALAGRKSMVGITWTTTAAAGASSNETTATTFFNTNFVDGKYGTSGRTSSFTASNTGAVTGTASITVPMTLMSIFRIPSRTIAVSCTANLQLPNTDVMFVLDTTLSMYDTNPGDSQSKIAILRSAVSDFYTQLEAAKAAGSQIRYGFVPYSSTVNVGMLLQRDWVQDLATYDSRVPDGTSTYTSGGAGSTMNSNDPWKLVSGTSGPGATSTGQAENCVVPANTLSDTSQYTAWNPPAPATPRERTRTRTRNGTTYSKSGVCTITSTVYNNLIETQVERIIDNPNAGQTTTSTIYHWIYKPVTYSMANLKGTGAGTGLVTGTTGNTASTALLTPTTNNYAANDITPGSVAQTVNTWNATNGACIEERATRRTNETFLTRRYDMDVDLIPTPGNPETQWKPFLPKVIYGRVGGSSTATSGWLFGGSPTDPLVSPWSYTRVLSPNSTSNYYNPSGSYAACPTKALKLATITSSALTAYLASLTPAGYTYHDIGMLWGLRLISRDGIFGTENRAAETTGSISRNIIFMTDGETDTRIQAYDAWGLSAVSRRRTSSASIPTDTGQDAITEARLSELCTIAKNDKNITVWVIAFGTSLTTMLSDCASPGRAYQADNATQLAATFAQIASQIAQLRLVQ